MLSNRINKNNLLVSIFVFFLSYSANAQGIEFFHGSFEEAKLLASKENKPLFVDVFTSWCGPCKKLSKTVFTKKSVGDYFNENFICFKLQADKKGGENKKIADQYKVTAYPTLLWLDGDGKVLHAAIGFKEPKSLIKEAKIVFNENKRMGNIIEKWHNGDRSSNVILKYFAFDRNANGEFDTYFNTLSEEQKLNKDLFILLSDIQLDLNGEVFEFIVKHRADYLKIVNFWNVNRVIDNRIEEQIVENYRSANYDALLEKYRKLGIEQTALYAKKAEWMYYLKNKEFEQFEKSAKEYISDYYSQRNHVYFELITSLFKELPKEDLLAFTNRKIVIDWALTSVKNSKKKIGNGSLLVQAYIVAGEYEKAKQVGEEYLKKLETEKSKISGFYIKYITNMLKEIE
jgi:thioredoxin-related protein